MSSSSTARSPSASGPGSRYSASASASSSCSTRRRSSAVQRASGSSPATSSPSTPPASRSPTTAGSRSPGARPTSSPTGSPARRRSTSSTALRRAPPTPRTCSARPSTETTFAVRRRPRQRSRRPVPPGEVRPRGTAAARELHRHLRALDRGRLILYPAIDIRDGHAVRLVQGDYSRETVFDADPVEAALRWVDQGAEALHVVDLDGAREGRPVNLDHIRRICAVAEVPVQLGGGLRSADDVDEALEAGAERAILGSAAVSDPALIDALTSTHGERIVVSADSKAGRVAVEGWERATAITSAEPDRLAGRPRRSQLRLHAGRGRRHARRPGARRPRRRLRRGVGGRRRSRLLGWRRVDRPPALAGGLGASRAQRA